MNISDLWQAFSAWLRPPRIISERRWRRMARCTRCRTFMAWLSEQVADDIIRRKPIGTSIEEISVAVIESPASDLQHRAERFIERFYYDYPFDDDPDYFMNVASLRKMIQGHLRRHVTSQNDPAAD